MKKVAEDKKSIFGQMTLIGLMALDWLKPEGKTTFVKTIMMGEPEAFTDRFYIPEWAMKKPCIAILFDLDKFVQPLLVSQKSALEWLETMAMEWDGACGKAVLHNVDGKQYCELSLDDGEERLINIKKSGKKQFDKYTCKIIVPKEA